MLVQAILIHFQIIEAHNEMQMYLGLDIDSMAHAMARHRIEALLDGAPGLKAYTHVRNFKYIKSVLTDVDENLLSNGVDGILMDLGMSSMQVYAIQLFEKLPLWVFTRS